MKKNTINSSVPKIENVEENRFPAIGPMSISFKNSETWKLINLGSVMPRDRALDDTILLSFFSYCGSCWAKRPNESIITEEILPKRKIIINRSKITRTDKGMLYLPSRPLNGEKTKNRK